jgi:protein O-mannosyl-transferase
VTISPRFISGSRRRFLVRLALVCTLCLSASVYFQALRFDFIADDHALIENNPAISSWGFVPSYFVTDVWHPGNPHGSGTYYRPIFELWLLLNHLAFGLDTWSWHLTTLGLHLFCTLLVYLLARELTKDAFFSIAAALLFGLHPVHIEGAAWALGSNELVLSVFLIGFFLCYLISRRDEQDAAVSKRWLAASVVIYGFALFAKETAVLGWAFIFAYEWLFPSRACGPAGSRPITGRLSAAFQSSSRYLLLAALYMGARIIVLRGLGAPRNLLSWSANMLTLPSVLAGYIKFLVWPVQMSPFYDYPFITVFSIREVLAPAIGVSLLGGALIWLSRKSRVVAFACVWLVVPMLVLLNLRVFSEGAICRTHWLYLPSVGFCLLCAAGLKALRNLPVQLLALAVLASFLGYETSTQARYWASDWEAARRGMQVAPGNYLVQFATAEELSRAGLAAEAIPYLQRVLASRKHYKSMVLLGECYEKVQMHDEAERCEREAADTNPYDPEPRVALGLIKEHQGRLKDAEKYIREALRLQALDRPEPHAILAEVLTKQGNTREAAQEQDKAAALDSRNIALQAVLESR